MIRPAARQPLEPAASAVAPGRPASPGASGQAFAAVLATVPNEASAATGNPNVVAEPTSSEQPAAPADVAPAKAVPSDVAAGKDGARVAPNDDGLPAATPELPGRPVDDEASPELPAADTDAATSDPLAPPQVTAPSNNCLPLCPVATPPSVGSSNAGQAGAAATPASIEFVRMSAPAPLRQHEPTEKDAAVTNDLPQTGATEPSPSLAIAPPPAQPDQSVGVALPAMLAPSSPSTLPPPAAAVASLAGALLAHATTGGEGQRDWAGTFDAGGAAWIEARTHSLGAVAIEVTRVVDGLAIALGAPTNEARALLADAQPRLAADARAAGFALSQSRVDDAPSGDRRGGGRQPRSRFATLTPASPATSASPADRYA